MRVLVTGGAGFIGSHIVDQLLADGHEACAFDNLSSGSRDNLPHHMPLIVGDICDREAVRRVFEDFRPDRICHQAAQMSVSRSVREPAFDAEVNVLGLLHVLEESARAGVRRVVFASSGGALYGDVYEPAPEDHPCAPAAPYGISKWVGEHYLRFFAGQYGLPAVALRYTNVYGPRQNPHGEAGVVAIFCQRMLRGEGVTINGDGKYVRDYVYVDDVARANVRALEAEKAPPFQAFNVGTGRGTDVNELEARVRGLCGRRRMPPSAAVPPPQHGPPREGDLRSSLVSSRLAGDVLDWRPAVSLDEGLETTVRWFAEQAADSAPTQGS